MRGEQSRTLVVGDRVRWGGDVNDLGTATDKNWAGVTIKWDNRKEQSILHSDMKGVFVVVRRPSKRVASVTSLNHSALKDNRHRHD